jgi:hypothetical protein
MTSLKLPAGIHSALAGLHGYPLADLEILRLRWKVVTLKTAKVRETEAAKLLRFIVDLHAALEGHPRPKDYHVRPGEIVRDSIWVAVGIEGDPNPKLPESWLNALLPVWESWLENDTATKRRRGTVGQGRDAAGMFTKNPKHEGEFVKGNPHRFKKKQLPKK